MDSPPPVLPDDLDELRAVAATALAQNADDAAAIAAQKLEIAKLKRQIYGTRSERTARLIDQMELELEDLEVSATEDEVAAETAAAKTTTVQSYARERPSRQPFAFARLVRANLMHARSFHQLQSEPKPPPRDHAQMEFALC